MAPPENEETGMPNRSERDRAADEAGYDEKRVYDNNSERDSGKTISVQDVSTSDNVSKHTSDNRGSDAEHVPDDTIVAIPIPRERRRGLFARLSLVHEVTEPLHYPRRVKWFITFVVAFAAVAAPMGSAILFPTLEHVASDLNSTPTITNFSVALYMLAMAIFPLWWSSFSETSGRRSIYLVSFALYIVFSIISALSQNIAMLIVMRMLSGGAAASVQAVGAGTIADIWEPRERGKAMGWFYIGPLCGPLLANPVGGILGQFLGWRSTQYAQAIFGAITWLGILFVLPETLKSTRNLAEEAAVETEESSLAMKRTNTRQSVRKTSLKWLKIAKRLFIDPLMVIKYLQFLPVLLTVYYASITFGALYVLNVSIQYTFEREPYDYQTIIIGLLYLPNSLGYVLASIFGGRWMDKIMAREAIKANRLQEDGKLIYRPEDRMRENAWLGAVLYPCALIWYGWTVDKHVFWVVPMIANFAYGIGSMLIFAMAMTMLTEFMPGRSASGVALNNLVRNILSCAGAIIGVPVIDAIGNGWLFTILGLWTFTTGCLVIWAMKRFGPRWRMKMDACLQ